MYFWSEHLPWILFLTKGIVQEKKYEWGGHGPTHWTSVVMIDVTKEQLSPQVNADFCAEWVNSLWYLLSSESPPSSSVS